jgi:murein L,D-transpeptidase YcbB/YkuD
MLKEKHSYWLGILFCLFFYPGNAIGVTDIPATTESLMATVERVLEEGPVFDWPQIERLYDKQHHRFIWHHAGKLTAQGRQLFRWLASADLDGLDADDYHLDHIRGLVFSSSPDVLVYRELLLSDGYLRLARDLRLGRYDAHTLDPLWMLPGEDFDPVDALSSALSSGSLEQLLNTLRPTNNAYLQLKGALAKYRHIQAVGGWITLQVDNKLQLGDRNPGVSNLRRRLSVESIHTEGEVSDPNYFDAGLELAVKRFQQRFGLLPDGIVGVATLRALNDPVERRIEQIRVNLERWRWLPHELESQHLMVNTAGFEIMLVKHDRIVFRKRTVNGRMERQTPSFSSQVTHLVMNPSWTVPRTIAVQDILPKLQQDSEYLANKQLRVYARSDGEWLEIDPIDIDWADYDDDNFPFVLRQDAGNKNSLGRIKFHMPNSHQIYLHDTPSPGLFERPNRAYSSGCVRVEAAEQLAQLLVKYAEQPHEEWLQQALSSGETRITSLAKPMPIYLTYFTSWVDTKGDIHFRPDVYHRDTALMLVMDEGINPNISPGRLEKKLTSSF